MAIEKTVQRPLKRREILEIYSEIVDGRRRRFPNGFFDGNEGKRRAAVLTRYLIRHIAGFKLHEIPQKLTKEVFYRHKLTWMLASCFNWSPYLAIEAAFPGRFHPVLLWEASALPAKNRQCSPTPATQCGI